MVTASWQRVFISAPQLYSLFPSVHPNNVAVVLKGLQQLSRAHNSNSLIELSESMSTESIIDAQRLMLAFHCANYLYNPRDTLDANTSAAAAPTTGEGTALPRFPSSVSLAAHGALSRQVSVAAPSLNPSGPSVQNLTATDSGGGGGAGGTVAAPVSAAASAKDRAGGGVVTPRELLFQDFCIVIALYVPFACPIVIAIRFTCAYHVSVNRCRNGTVAEQLAFLFMLFSEVSDSSNVPGPAAAGEQPGSADPRSRASSVKVQAGLLGAAGAGPEEGRQSRSGSLEKASPGVGAGASEAGDSEAEPAAVGAAGGVEMPVLSKSVSVLSASASPAPPMKSRMFSFLSRPAAAVEKSALEKRRLTETGALKLLLFLHLQLLKKEKFPDLTLAYNRQGGSKAWSLRQMLESVDWMDGGGDADSTQWLQDMLGVVEVLLAVQAVSPGGTVGPTQGLSFAELARSVLPPTPVDGAEPAIDGKMQAPSLAPGSSALDTLLGAGSHLAAVVQAALRELSNDLLHAAEQVRF